MAGAIRSFGTSGGLVLTGVDVADRATPDWAHPQMDGS